MYELFIGNYERVMGQTVYFKKGNTYIPCTVTNYYFKPRKYALVPTEDMENISNEECSKRRLFNSAKIYVKTA